MLRYALAVIALARLSRARSSPRRRGPRTSPRPAAATRILYPSAPGSFVDLVANARHGVVAIRAATPVKSGPAAMFPGAPEPGADVALGTGFLIEAQGVFVLTNDHIAAAATELHVVLARRHEVARQGSSAATSGSISRCSRSTCPRLQPLALGDSDDLQVGEWLVVLGDPFGDEVTAVGRHRVGDRPRGRGLARRRPRDGLPHVPPDRRAHPPRQLRRPGARHRRSGRRRRGRDRRSPRRAVVRDPDQPRREVVDALRDFGQVARGWLGVPGQAGHAGARATRSACPRPTGALVTEVKAGSPAARSGLRAGDIILKWGDREVDHRSLPWIVAQTPIGKPTTVDVWRNHAEAQVTVVTEKMPE